MTESTSILLFGDQTGDYGTTFRGVLRIKDNPLLSAFLDRSYFALQQELANQPLSVREQSTNFSSIADLVARYADSEKPRSNALESALTYISQISSFFGYKGSGLDEYPTHSSTHIVGSCTGLLAAAAVSSARNHVDLLTLAVELVSIAYRIGSLVTETRDNIEQAPGRSPSWSVVLPGLRKEEAVEILKSFHENHVRPGDEYVATITNTPSMPQSRIKRTSVQSAQARLLSVARQRL